MRTTERSTDRTNIRITPSLLARVDAFAERLREATGLRVLRAEAIRLLVERAVIESEANDSDYIEHVVYVNGMKNRTKAR